MTTRPSRSVAKRSTAVKPNAAPAADDRCAAAPLPLTVGADLWLSRAGRNLAGSRRIALLAEIARAGSITQAAKTAGLSYKGAWDAIEQMGNLAGEALVERVAGGRGGGHTHLTHRGELLVRHFEGLQAEHQRFVEQLNRRAAGKPCDDSLIGHFAMKFSARNQFAGTVRRIRDGAVNDEVELEVIGGQTIVATITHNSRLELGLQPGSSAVALIKASSIMLMTTMGGAKLSSRNQLAGKVSRISPGAVNTEVVVDLAGGGTIAAIITEISASELGLRKRCPVTAVFNASSVIVGVSA